MPLGFEYNDKILQSLYDINRFALIYQLVKPFPKKITTQTSKPGVSDTKIISKDKDSSPDGSGAG